MTTKKVFSLLLFFLCLLFTGFVLGGFIGAQWVPKDAGLAGGAIVLAYAAVGVLVGLALGSLLVWKLPEAKFRTAFRIVGAFALVAIGIVAYRFFTMVKPQRDQQRFEQENRPPMPPKPTAPAQAIDVGRPPSGIGMAKPILSPEKTLHFFNKPNSSSPIDSLVFRNGENFVEITYRPADFSPEYLKLDYDLFFLRVMSKNAEWLEVETIAPQEKTAWVKSDDVVWHPWAAFIPNVYAIEHLYPQDFPVREEPFNHSAPLDRQPRAPWKVKKVEGDWLKIKGSGWLRWRQDGKQIIRFVYLS